MQKYIRKANVLIEALPYIQQFRNKTVVIKYGGSIIGNNEFSEMVLQDIVFMECIGINPVLIHGGGHAITDAMKRTGQIPKFINGLRVTDKKTIGIAEDILTNKINNYIVSTIKSFGGKAVGISGKTGIIEVEKHMPALKDKDTGRAHRLDIGYVGDVVNIYTEPIIKIIKEEKVPVIIPLGFNKDKNTYNVNADTAAGEIACRLKAEKLVFLTDVEGIMKDTDDKTSLVSTLKKKYVLDFIKRGIIREGMIPKVKSCLSALESGVKKTHIIDGRISHSLLLEIFTDKGIGTEIIR